MNGLLILVAVDAAVWVAISVAAGLGAGVLPRSMLSADNAISRIRRFEDDGRFYRRRLAIKRWKDMLPESNRLGPGQRPSKARLSGRNAVAGLAVETRRAEYVHLAIAAAGPLFFLWNPWWLGLIMTVFGAVFNAPFIAIQRYNRARILAITSTRARCAS